MIPERRTLYGAWKQKKKLEWIEKPERRQKWFFRHRNSYFTGGFRLPELKEENLEPGYKVIKRERNFLSEIFYKTERKDPQESLFLN